MLKVKNQNKKKKKQKQASGGRGETSGKELQREELGSDLNSASSCVTSRHAQLSFWNERGT